jgi:hypothetical protein
MNPALLWIDIIVVAFVISVYLVNIKGAVDVPSSSFYINGKDPKPATYRQLPVRLR